MRIATSVTPAPCVHGHRRLEAAGRASRSTLTLSRISRLIVLMAALTFGAVAIGIWTAPLQAAQRLGLEAASATGRATLRADLGGVFAAMAVLCGTAAVTRRRMWGVAAAVLPTMIAAGRLLDWLASAGATLDIGALVVELGVVAAILGSTLNRKLPNPRR